MNNFKIIIRILKLLEESLDDECFDIKKLDPELLDVSRNRRNALLKMLSDEGYINGIMYIDGMPGIKISPDICITLKGLEYLENNTLIKQAAQKMRDIKDINPLS